jgi:hypothetical protein
MKKQFSLAYTNAGDYVTSDASTASIHKKSSDVDGTPQTAGFRIVQRVGHECFQDRLYFDQAGYPRVVLVRA